MRRIATLHLAIILLVIAVLAGCAAPTAPAPAPAAAPTKSSQAATAPATEAAKAPAPTKAPEATAAPSKLSMTDIVLVSSSVSPPSISNIYYFAGIDRGYFKKNGLNVTAQQSGGSPLSIAAISSGQAQVASVALTTLANAAAEGGKLRLVVTGNFDFPGAIVVTEKIQSVSDLSRATMATTAMGSINQTTPLGFLRKQKIDTSGIQWVATGSDAASVQAVGARKADAAWLTASTVVKALKEFPGLRILVDAKTLAAVAPASGGIVVVTEDFATKNADVVQAFVTAVVEGNRDLYQNESTYASIANARMPGVYTSDELHDLYLSYRPSFGVNGGLEMETLTDAFEQWRTEINPKAAAASGLKLNQLIDTKFAAAALDKLGVFPGATDAARWR